MGRLQNVPPSNPSKTNFASVVKSEFGAPKDAPRSGKMNVIKETVIKALRLGSNQPMDCEIFLTENAEIKIIPTKTAMAAPNEGGSRPILIIISDTNVANTAPVPAPAIKVCFQSIILPSA